MNYPHLGEDFSHYYTKYIEEDVAEVEEKRKIYARNTRSAKVRIVLSALVGFVISPILEIITGFPFIFLGLIITVPVIVLHFYVINVMRGDFQSNVKYGLIKKAIHSLHPSLRYSPDTFVHPKHFIDANLYPKEKIATYTGKNYIFGEVSETTVSFSEINAKKQRNGSIFKGLFFVIDFHKPFNESLYITRNTGKNSSLFSVRETNNNEEYLEHIILENPAFQKRYTVRASNQIAARYILTPSFMERILRYEENTQSNIIFSIRNGKLYLGFVSDTDHLNFHLKKPIDQQALYHYLLEINIAISIVDELRLNQNIWS